MRRSGLRLAGLLVLLAGAASAWANPVVSAYDLLSAGRADDAIQVLKAAGSANPKDAEVFHLLTRTYFYMGRWDEAVEAAQQAVDLGADNSDYHLWLGRAYGEKAAHSRFVTAVRMVPKIRGEFERAVQLNGASVSARSDLAEFYLEAPGFLGGGKDKARAQAEKLAQHDAAAAHWVTARLAEKAKHYDEAEREYVAAVQASKTPASRWVDLAAFYRSIGRLELMQNAINRALKSEGRKGSVLFDAAGLLVDAGRNFPQAIELAREYLNSEMQVEEAPAYRAHYLLGSIFEKQGDKSAAAAEYRTALSLAREFQDAQVALKRVQ